MNVRMQAILLLVCALALGAAAGVLLTSHVPGAQAAGEEEGNPPAGGAKERIVPLRELLPPMRTERLELRPVTRIVIGGIIWNDGLWMHGATNSYALWDTGGTYDLLEGYFGIDDADDFGTKSATLVITGDGKRLGSVTLHHGDKARFFACPMNHCRALQLQMGSGEPDAYHSLIVTEARLVSGRTKPSQPLDLIIDDGETKYIEQPGEYKFHVRMPR